MRHWTQLGEAPIPGTGQSLTLHRDKDDFYIRISGGGELMSSRRHGSEDALGHLPCKRLANSESARVLVGGLGMGFTLAAALNVVGSSAEVTVAELIPEVVDWNRGPLGDCSDRPLDDPRTHVFVGDVAEVLAASPGYFDVIALDVDNGPEGMTQSDNDRLYAIPGISAAKEALKPGGILAYWSAARDPGFLKRLRQCGFRVEEVMVHAHGKKGARHYIWLADSGGSKRG
jgi:spermidine synthase